MSKKLTWQAKRERQGAAARRSAARLTPRTAAAKLRKAASKHLEFAKKKYEDQDMKESAAEDVDTLRYIASLITSGENTAAMSSAARLDTFVRELIPFDVWIYLGGDPVYG